MVMKEIRERSLSTVQKLGYETNLDLPLLDDNIFPRPIKDIVCRSLALFAVVACSYGFNKKSALLWIEQEGIMDYVTESEVIYLVSEESKASKFQLQVEDLYTFAWALGFIKTISFDSVCNNTLIKFFPDIKTNESSLIYKNKSSLKDKEELISALDILYCIHWAINDMNLRNIKLPNNINSYVFIERRRVLEWILGTEEWDDISLDT